MKKILLLLIGCLSFSQAYAQLNVPSKFVGYIARSNSATVQTGTTILPYDNTAPLITEGDEFYNSGAVSCKSSGNRQMLLANIPWSSTSSSGSHFTCAVWQNSTLVYVQTDYQPSNGQSYNMQLQNERTCFTGTATITIRCGSNNAGTTTINGVGGAQMFGTSLRTMVYLF
jgi:hypothetical protein